MTLDGDVLNLRAPLDCTAHEGRYVAASILDTDCRVLPYYGQVRACEPAMMCDHDG